MSIVKWFPAAFARARKAVTAAVLAGAPLFSAAMLTDSPGGAGLPTREEWFAIAGTAFLAGVAVYNVRNASARQVHKTRKTHKHAATPAPTPPSPPPTT